MVRLTLEAADRLAAEGIEADVIDPRTLRPLDEDTILDSVRRTGRGVIVHEANRTYGVGAEFAALIMEKAFDSLDAPVLRVAGLDTPVPYGFRLEEEVIPNLDRVIEAVHQVVS